MGRKESIKKEINLSKLPKTWRGVDWEKSANNIVSGVYDDILFDIFIKSYNSKNQRLTIIYNNKEYEVKSNNFVRCKLGSILGKTTSEFKIEIGTNFKDDRRDITIIDRKKMKNKNGQWLKYYKHHCNLCGFDSGEHWNIKENEYKDEYWVEENHLLERKQGCVCCLKVPQIIVKHINSIYTENKWNLQIIKKSYEPCKNEDDLYKDGIKYPNKFMTEVLRQLNIEFETEYSPEWVGLRRYDFYIPSMNLITEMDGGFHNKDNKRSGQTKEESKYIDDEKDRLALEHNIEVVRIDCDYSNIETRFEFIKENTIEKLNNIFNLNNIDWSEVNKFALSNLIKVACKIKTDNPNMTTTEIGNSMGYSQVTISDWLKLGTFVGWCEYNPKYEAKLSLEKGRIAKRIPLEVFKNGISQGIFESATYLEKHSEELFGIKFVRACITQSCLNKPKYMIYKGYEFNYITQDEYDNRKAEENLKQAM